MIEPDARADDPAVDAVLLLSFGGPEGPADVLPFLRNVTRGRDVPPERLAEVATQYERFGGVSPINGQNRALVDAIGAELSRRGLPVPVVLGNRNWYPYLADTLHQLVVDGHRRIVVIATSAFGSYSGCRQYREDLDAACTEVARRLDTPARGAQPPGDPSIDGVTVTKVRPFWNHPGFLDAATDRLLAELAELDDPAPALVFTAHSIPSAWVATSPYVDQLRAAAGHLAATVAPDLRWDLVFQSRSGPPQVPWLEPDVGDHLEMLAAQGLRTACIFPLGFVSDHMEVVFDLDTLAAERAAAAGIATRRVPTVGTHPRFVAGLADLVGEVAHGRPALAAVGEPWACPDGCCDRPAGRPGRPVNPSGA